VREAIWRGRRFELTKFVTIVEFTLVAAENRVTKIIIDMQPNSGNHRRTC